MPCSACSFASGLWCAAGSQTVVCLSLLYCLCALLLAPHVVLPSALLALCLRYRFSLCLDGQGATAGDVERFMDRAASGLRDAGERLSARVTGGTRANARDAAMIFGTMIGTAEACRA